MEEGFKLKMDEFIMEFRKEFFKLEKVFEMFLVLLIFINLKLNLKWNDRIKIFNWMLKRVVGMIE